MMIDLINCIHCHQQKERSEYYGRPKAKPGTKPFSQPCKVCHCERNRQKRKEDPKPWNEKNERYRKRHPETCKKSRSTFWRKYRFGITDKQYEDMVAGQGGKCAVCQESAIRLCVDHCHQHEGPKADGIRGVLCAKCNMGIGLLGDRAESVRKALAYLERFEAKA